MASVAVAFDTLKAATRLQDAGFDETKARAQVSTFAEGLVENLATKDDIAALRREIATMATKEDLKAFATKEDLKGLATKEDLKALATKEAVATLRGEIVKVQERMTVRLGAAIATAVAVLVAVDKLL